jgi:hypothetical protein
MGEWLYGFAYTYLSARYGVSVEDCALALIEEIQDKINRSSISFNPRSNDKSPRHFLSLKKVGDSLFEYMNHTTHKEIPNKTLPNTLQMLEKLSLCLIRRHGVKKYEGQWSYSSTRS